MGKSFAQEQDKGNYKHMAQILTSVALYETLQKHGRSEAEAYTAVSEEMWRFLDPSGMQKLAKRRFFLPLMKKIVPFGFQKGSGTGWRYTWHKGDAVPRRCLRADPRRSGGRACDFDSMRTGSGLSGR